jgi:hypothetical protein
VGQLRPALRVLPSLPQLPRGGLVPSRSPYKRCTILIAGRGLRLGLPRLPETARSCTPLIISRERMELASSSTPICQATPQASWQAQSNSSSWLRQGPRAESSAANAPAADRRRPGKRVVGGLRGSPGPPAPLPGLLLEAHTEHSECLPALLKH